MLNPTVSFNKQTSHKKIAVQTNLLDVSSAANTHKRLRKSNGTRNYVTATYLG